MSKPAMVLAKHATAVTDFKLEEISYQLPPLGKGSLSQQVLSEEDHLKHKLPMSAAEQDSTMFS